MQLLIDGDGCPVIDISVRLCRKYAFPCLILCDTAHEFHREGAETLVFDKGMDSVDYQLANLATIGDIVITQDYGLASLCLAKKAIVLHQDGWLYTQDNIDALLFQRHESQKIRASGGHTRGQKKRTKRQDTAFETALERLFQTCVHGNTDGGS